VQVLVGQAGLFLVLFLAYQNSSDLAEVWDSYLRSGNSYVFAIAILSSTLAAVGCEFVETLRDKSSALMSERKLIWGVAAAVLVLIQAGLVGPLLVPPTTTAVEITGQCQVFLGRHSEAL
jgi:predicted small lipoprotein YifL